MAKVVQTAFLTDDGSETEKLWIYNGLDCCITREVLDVLRPEMDDVAERIYRLRLALQAPVFEMNIRGIRVDLAARDRVTAEFNRRSARLESQFNRLLTEGVGVPVLNWASPKQLMWLFYEVMKLPPVMKRNANGVMAPTINRDALESLENYWICKPLITHILALRDLQKKIGVLHTKVDSDGRMRTSFNIGGTETGRFSSSMSDLETGTNLQNIEEQLRSVFVADPGMKLGSFDLEQAESRIVGAICWNLFGASRYLDAGESGDMHTAVSKLTQPKLGWTGDPAHDRALAERPFYRHHSLRYLCKRLAHGSNYMGTPFTMAQHTKMPIKVIRDFQVAYFEAFPELTRWHKHVEQVVATQGVATTMLGMRRWFFGRRNDPATVREAVAFEPQSVCAQVLNEGMLAVWRANICQLLLQVHDSIVVQYPEEKEDEIVPQILKLMERPIQLRDGRTLLIPVEAKTGWSWGNQSSSNPNGLKTYRGTDGRSRTSLEETRVMD